MKLVTFQSFGAVKYLFNNGYLECDESKIELSKVGYAYNWVVENMNKYVKNQTDTKFPIWCWVKCYNGVCPPKKRGVPVNDFDVKITFHKDEKDVFITDFRRYSFLLNNTYIPNNKKEKEMFAKKLEKYNISSDDLKAFVRKDKYSKVRNDKEFIDVCAEIRNTFSRCITSNSDILQGCVWRIDLKDIEKIEILANDGYIYGSLNYVRSNGKRFDWVKEYYDALK